MIFKWTKRIFLGLLGLVVLLLIIGVIYEQASRYSTNKKFPANGTLVDVGGHKLNINIKGTGGPVVVFESGLDQGGGLPWYKVQKEVSKFTTTASYDRAGVMWSERGDNPKTNAFIAEELHTLLKNSNQPAPYILVGHSLAGYMLRSFVSKYPNEVAGVVFVDVSHPDQFNRFPKEILEMSGRPSPLTTAITRQVGVVRLSAKNQYPSTQPTDSINIIANAFTPVSLVGVLDEISQLKPLGEEAAAITSFGDIPLIVITGGNPARYSFLPQKLGHTMDSMWVQMQNEITQLSTKGEHITALKSGHYVQLDEPEVVVEAIKKLVNKRDSVRQGEPVQ